jgi:hypothetical protein
MTTPAKLRVVALGIDRVRRDLRAFGGSVAQPEAEEVGLDRQPSLNPREWRRVRHHEPEASAAVAEAELTQLLRFEHLGHTSGRAINYRPQVIRVDLDHRAIAEDHLDGRPVVGLPRDHAGRCAVGREHPVADIEVAVGSPPVRREHGRRVGDQLAVPRRQRDHRTHALAPRPLEDLEDGLEVAHRLQVR